MRVCLRRSADVHIIVAAAIFGVWLLLVLLSPFLVEYGSINNLSGSVFSLDNLNEFSDFNPVARIVYILGDVNCHQIEERSFFLNENQMPFCARDTGIFIGLFSGTLIALLIAIRIKLHLLFLGILPLIIDGSFQELTGYASTNVMRVATGILAGGVIALYLCDKIAMPTEEDILSEKSTPSLDEAKMK